MPNDTLSIGQSGMHSAVVRLRDSAHNVANVVTPEFRNHRTEQVSRSGGGSDAYTRVDKDPAEVDITHEFVQQSLAKVQYAASARVIGTDLQLKGSLLDAFA